LIAFDERDAWPLRCASFIPEIAEFFAMPENAPTRYLKSDLLFNDIQGRFLRRNGFRAIIEPERPFKNVLLLPAGTSRVALRDGRDPQLETPKGFEVRPLDRLG
jgi:hypothetical protein